MRSAIKRFVVVIFTITAPTFASAALVSPSEDAHVLSTFPDTNEGTSTQLYMASAGSIGFSGNRAFLKFPNSFSPSLTVNSATLKVFYYQNVGNGSSAVSAYSVTDDTWTESGVTWNNQPSLGSFLDTDVPSLNNYALLDVTSFVQSEISAASPSISISLVPENNISWARYYSREGSNPPVLEIAVPEPSTLTLAALGLLGLLGFTRRRRR
jgi:hyaluronate lyase